MKIEKVVAWLDSVLEPWKFDDVSNNGLQMERSVSEVRGVAFAVDAGVGSIRAAAAAGADMLVR